MIGRRTPSADCYPQSLTPVSMRSVHPTYRTLFTGLVLMSLSCGCSSSTTSSDNERVTAQRVEPDNATSIASTPHRKWESLDNPSQDGWSSEAFADAATKQLKQLASNIGWYSLALADLEGLALAQSLTLAEHTKKARPRASQEKHARR